MPGRLPDVHNRFANHTIGLFEKHGIENIGYWSEDVGVNNVLVYMLGYPSSATGEELAVLPGRPRVEQGACGERGRRPDSSRLETLHHAPDGLRIHQRLIRSHWREVCGALALLALRLFLRGPSGRTGSRC